MGPLLSGTSGKAFNEELNQAVKRTEALVVLAGNNGSFGCFTFLKARRNGPNVPVGSQTPA